MEKHKRDRQRWKQPGIKNAHRADKLRKFLERVSGWWWDAQKDKSLSNHTVANSHPSPNTDCLSIYCTVTFQFTHFGADEYKFLFGWSIPKRLLISGAGGLFLLRAALLKYSWLWRNNWFVGNKAIPDTGAKNLHWISAAQPCLSTTGFSMNFNALSSHVKLHFLWQYIFPWFPRLKF